MDDPEVNELWLLVLEQVERCRKEEEAAKTLHSSSREAAMVTRSGVHVAVSTLFDVRQPDGSSKVYWIKASKGSVGPRVDVKVMHHNSEEFWLPRIKEYHQEPIVVIDNVYYGVAKDSQRPGPGDGYGGRSFTIHVLNNAAAQKLQEAGLNIHRDAHLRWVLKTRNLWNGGRIPPVFRDRLPNNAKFISPEA